MYVRIENIQGLTEEMRINCLDSVHTNKITKKQQMDASTKIYSIELSVANKESMRLQSLEYSSSKKRSDSTNAVHTGI